MSQPAARPEVIFFDVGDTLVRPDPSWSDVYRQACLAYGLELDRDTVAEALRAAVAAGGLDELGPFEASPEASFARIRRFDEGIMAAAGYHDLPEDFYRRISRTFAERASWHVFPDVVPALERLRSAGVRTAVVSNWLWEAPELLHELDLARHFETLVISDRVGYNKPHRAIFEEALGRMGVAPERALHVGDSYRNDVLGARAAGIHPVLIERARRAGELVAGPAVESGVPVVHDLFELLGLLDLAA
jgi:putative hydrolase of the HAD superfamily